MATPPEIVAIYQKELALCGVTEKEIVFALDLLQRRLSSQILERVYHEGFSVSGIVNIFERCELFNSLHLNAGFEKVVKEINKSINPIPTLYQPHGYWFQLRVGYLFRSIKFEPEFEYMIGPSRKDVVISKEKIVVECKSFDHGIKISRAIEDMWISGKQRDHLPGDRPASFTQTFLLTGPFLDPRYAKININEYDKVIEKGIVEKVRQLEPGFKNVIALNVGNIVRDIHTVSEELKTFIMDKPIISGLILHSIEGIREEFYSLKGLRHNWSVIGNPKALIPLEKGLLEAIPPIMEIKWTSIG